MWTLFLILIQPNNGPFRTKITSMEDQITAYKLLERNSDKTIQEQIKHKQEKIELLDDETTKKNSKELKSISINEIKSDSTNKLKLIWNYGQIFRLSAK